MPATRLADVIVPAVWNPYMVQRTAEQSALFQSGLVRPVEELEGIAGEGGNVINMPFWNDLTGDDEVLSATGGALTVSNMTTAQDKAVIFFRGRAWGFNELAGHLAGDDPSSRIGDLVGAYWGRRFQAATVSILKGLFATAGALAGTHLHDVSAATDGTQVVSADGILDATQKLGDAKGQLTAIAMHSATENKLKKLGLIDYVDPADGSPRYAVYLDKRVIVDDGLPVSAGTYDTYLFGPGAIGYVEVTNSKVTATETDRDTLAGEDILINRRTFILHPRGVKWAAADPTGGGATNATLEAAATWSRVYEVKNIRIVCYRHKIA